ncbi:hypothetical protein [Clostridium intestinale]|uniref:hypothetical protein n=1 Tax=Clostridium intestinale TaxID=36845 RepID=UPI0028EEA718|nr:hypothetical protein [Clostridium intestinale]
MSKLISVLEKLNVVEKVQQEVSNNDSTNKNIIKKEASPKEASPKEDSKISVSTQQETKVFTSPTPHKNNFENSTIDKSLDISEIYALFGIDSNKTNTIFMLGQFINAIPESLPHDIRKESVMNILTAAKSNFTDLIKDGEIRLNTLNDFTAKFHDTVNSKIDEYNMEISKLKSLISDYEIKIENKKNMLSKQDSTVKYELQKINSIINFFK